MSEAVVVAIVSVASVLFLAAAGAIWRLGAADAEKANQIKALRADLDRLAASVSKIDADVELQHREDEKQWRSWTQIISELVGEIRGRQPPALTRSPRRSRHDEEP